MGSLCSRIEAAVSRPNTAWQRARREAGIPDLHIHDLRYTAGKRLREAEVREETIADILWHTRPGLTAHYSVAQVAELVGALNRVTDERSRTNRSLAMIAREAKGEKILQKLPMQMKNG
jgi:integrase